MYPSYLILHVFYIEINIVKHMFVFML